MKMSEWKVETIAIEARVHDPISFVISPMKFMEVLQELDDDVFIDVVINAAQLSQEGWAAFVAEANQDNE